MKNNNIAPLHLALYGMDTRASKTMAMYLKGPCKGIALVVSEADADIDVLDADNIKAKDFLEKLQAKVPVKPIILLSLEKIVIEGTIYLKKPVVTGDMLAALKKAKGLLDKDKTRHTNADAVELQQAVKPVGFSSATKRASDGSNKQVEPKKIDRAEKKKVSKHRTAKDLTEGSFSTYMGNVEGVDFSDPKQVLTASYDPQHYFLGYVQSALKTSIEKNKVFQLNSGWKPLIILPNSKEIWLDADDKQLRAFASLEIKNNGAKNISLSPISIDIASLNKKMDGFYDSDHFLWKLAIWTSKGRYPEVIDINKPVYLIQWPNFTRLVVTPHAMRIAALLVREPRTAISIANALNIRPQYVFVFISAANMLGILGQARRQVDELIAPAVVKENKSKGLLSRILGRLRG